jgi:hypothetical protein
MPGATFQTNPIDLTDLLHDCHGGGLQLPDFQRRWVSSTAVKPTRWSVARLPSDSGGELRTALVRSSSPIPP